MPQMMPMLWMFLTLMTSTLFILLITFTYFMYLPSKLLMSKKFPSYILKLNQFKWTWKW